MKFSEHGSTLVRAVVSNKIEECPSKALAALSLGHRNLDCATHLLKISLVNGIDGTIPASMIPVKIARQVAEVDVVHLK